MISRRDFFGMLAGLASSVSPLKKIATLQGKKLDLKFSGTITPYYYTTFLVGSDALVAFKGNLPTISRWRWSYSEQTYVKIPHEEKL